MIGSIIEDWQQKIKSGRDLFLANEKDVFLVLLIALSSILSYGLGRLSKIEATRTPVTITAGTSSLGIKLNSAVPSAGERIVASKNGSKFYYPWCGGSKTIKAENKIYFSTDNEAIKAGYSLAGNCSKTP
jgi:hypothetical protein